MDALIIVLIACILCLRNAIEPAEEEILVRETRLNPDFYVDENAFMEVANALGFGANRVGSDNSDVCMWTEPNDDIPIDTTHFIQREMRRNRGELEGSSDSRGNRFRRMDRMAHPDN